MLNPLTRKGRQIVSGKVQAYEWGYGPAYTALLAYAYGKVYQRYPNLAELRERIFWLPPAAPIAGAIHVLVGAPSGILQSRVESNMRVARQEMKTSFKEEGWTSPTVQEGMEERQLITWVFMPISIALVCWSPNRLLGYPVPAAKTLQTAGYYLAATYATSWVWNDLYERLVPTTVRWKTDVGLREWVYRDGPVFDIGDYDLTETGREHDLLRESATREVQGLGGWDADHELTKAAIERRRTPKRLVVAYIDDRQKYFRKVISMKAAYDQKLENEIDFRWSRNTDRSLRRWQIGQAVRTEMAPLRTAITEYMEENGITYADIQAYNNQQSYGTKRAVDELRTAGYLKQREA